MESRNSFTFETVFSTDRNLNLLKRAKANGYFIRCIYILTKDPSINVIRVKTREANGGHGVLEDKIISRYAKCMDLISPLVKVCDIMHIYDNSKMPFRIFKKRKEQMFFGQMNFGQKMKLSDWLERLCKKSEKIFDFFGFFVIILTP